MHDNTISTFLWFDTQAEEAAKFYCSIFSNSKITSTGKTGTTFELNGQRYTAFNGGPHFKLSAAVSIFVSCSTQAEIDALWERFLSAGGTETRCGWLVDQFGLSWQIIPRQLLEMLSDPDPAKAGRAGAAMMQMEKINIAELQRAYAGA
ncbi:MAG TPA: VOC family protein [Kofleriaceae bacterium]|nr:VOC family protein [Kofleriaceae bacterium]